MESIMINKKIVAVLVAAGTLVAAGPASAHGRWHDHGGGGAVVGALIGGAVLGAIVSSALTPEPAYAAPAYQPVYQQPAQYQYQQTYAGPPPGTCYDGYRNAYVACGPQPAPDYYPQQGW
ncbi:ecotin precursor [Burkholderia glumae]|nr:Hypothetical protein bglu_1g27600 [Burkholderia glumae BGR1]PJO20262.1 ecotin precursor [Burkholderia glumae AU6208]PNL00735.1 ecotin precursor [Burkholderia glumae]QGA36937.1 ecotin precursor [Burkholderia glumae]QHP90617.1 ecotin precursor [Burkholderia glumae]